MLHFIQLLTVNF